MNKLLYFLLFIVSFASCENNKKVTKDDGQNKSILGDYFENQEAERLNEEGIEMSKDGNYSGGKLAFLKSLEIEPNNPILPLSISRCFLRRSVWSYVSSS